MANMTDTISFPEFEDIDPEAFEMYLDVDLDQLTVLFYGRDRRYSVNPRNPVLSILEDPKTNAVVGISLDRYMRQVVQEHPEMIAMAAAATILVGDELIPAGEFFRFPAGQSTGARLVESFRAARRAWKETGSHEREVQSIYRTLQRFA